MARKNKRNNYLKGESEIGRFLEYAKAASLVTDFEEERQLRNREQDFALAAGYDPQYGRYWETMPIEELRKAQDVR